MFYSVQAVTIGQALLKAGFIKSQQFDDSFSDSAAALYKPVQITAFQSINLSDKSQATCDSQEPAWVKTIPQHDSTTGKTLTISGKMGKGRGKCRLKFFSKFCYSAIFVSHYYKDSRYFNHFYTEFRFRGRNKTVPRVRSLTLVELEFLFGFGRRGIHRDTEATDVRGTNNAVSRQRQ